MADKRVLTGFDRAFVYVKDNGRRVSMYIDKGQELPDNLASGEIERLEKMGAFHEEGTRADRIRAHRAMLKAAAAADTSGTVPAGENRPETPWLNAPPGGAAPTVAPAEVTFVDEEGKPTTGDNPDLPVSEDTIEGTPATATAGGLGSDGRTFAEVEDTDLGKFNADDTVAFIGGRPEDERDHWLESERQGKNRKTVLEPFGAWEG